MTWASTLTLDAPNLKAFWAISIAFPAPLSADFRWSTREAMTIDGLAYTVAPIELDDIARLVRLEEIVIFNDAGQYLDDFYDQPLVGTVVRIWQHYGAGATWSTSDMREIFNSTLGPVGMGPSIRLRLKSQPYRQTPPITIGDVVAPEFRIPDGAEAITPDGKVILTQARI